MPMPEQGKPDTEPPTPGQATPETDPMTDYINQWVSIWSKIHQQVGPGMTEEAVIGMTRDIIGSFIDFIESNLTYYGFPAKEVYMRGQLAETIKKFSMNADVVMGQPTPAPEIAGGGFTPAANLPPPAGPGQVVFESPQGLPVYAAAGSTYKVVIDNSGKNTYDYRAQLRALGLQFNRDKKQWEGELAVDKIQAVKNFAIQSGLSFKTD